MSDVRTLAAETAGALRGVLAEAAEPGSELVVADQPESFARAVVDEIEGHGPLVGVQARELVQREYSWDASYTRLRNLLEA